MGLVCAALAKVLVPFIFMCGVALAFAVAEHERNEQLTSDSRKYNRLPR
jgi:predicted acyltransferase